MEPVVATSVETRESLWEMEKPGAFVINESGSRLLCECPCGCGTHMNLPIYRTESAKPEPTAWTWDGNRTHPTLGPSIRDVGSCFFHGHLTKGVWTFEADSGVKQG